MIFQITSRNSMLSSAIESLYFVDFALENQSLRRDSGF